jgi:Ca2+-binding RTX toxin-like protein
MSTVPGHHHHHHQPWGWSSSDTINLGQGRDTIFEHGHASVLGLFGQSTLSGGALQVIHAALEDHSLSGKATLLGGSFSAEFVSAKTPMQGGLSVGSDTLIGGAAHDSLSSGTHAHNLIEFLSAGGSHVVTDFVAGHNQLYVEGSTFAQLQHPQVSTIGGHTIIKLDGGSTTIEVKGVHIDTTHKPS